MKMRTSILLILLILAGIVIFFLNRQEKPGVDSSKSEKVNQDPAGKFAPVTITDCLDRTVTITRPVRRIAYIHLATAEALKILEAWQLVVARDGYIADEFMFPGIKEIPALNSNMTNPYAPDLELLLSLDLDLLILEEIPMPGINELIASIGTAFPVACFRFHAPENLEEQFMSLARLLDRKNEAIQYLDWYGRVMQGLIKKTAGMTEQEKIKVFHKSSHGQPSDIMTFSDELSFAAARNRITGSINIASDLPSSGGWVPAVDPEWLAAQELEALIILDATPGSYDSLITDTAPFKTHLKTVKELPVFAGSKAVKNNRVYMMGAGFFGTPRFVVGFAYMAKWFHPQLFADFDPQKIHQEYLTRFMDVDIDLSTQGLFVYYE